MPRQRTSLTSHPQQRSQFGGVGHGKRLKVTPIDEPSRDQGRSPPTIAAGQLSARKA